MAIDLQSLEKLKSEYEPKDAEDLISVLAAFLAIYADSGNWRVSMGEPPHNLRGGICLDFHPSNVVNGWSFADEALAAIRRFEVKKVLSNSTSRKARTEMDSKVMELYIAKLLQSASPKDSDGRMIPPVDEKEKGERLAKDECARHLKSLVEVFGCLLLLLCSGCNAEEPATPKPYEPPAVEATERKVYPHSQVSRQAWLRHRRLAAQYNAAKRAAMFGQPRMKPIQDYADFGEYRRAVLRNGASEEREPYAPTSRPDLIRRSDVIEAIEGIPTPATPKRLYSDDSYWNQKHVGRPTHPQSEAYIKHWQEKGPILSTIDQYTYATYEANPDDTWVPVTVEGNLGWIDPATGFGHRSGWGKGKLSVPVTPDMVPSPGSDGSMIVFVGDVEYDFWRVRWSKGQMSCTNAGWLSTTGTGIPINQQKVSQGTKSWPLRGSKVSYGGGLVFPDQLAAGSINHVLALVMRKPAGYGVGIASESDGDGTDELDLPEGAHVMLTKDFYRDHPRATLTAEQRTVADALLVYGAVVIDRGGNSKLIFHPKCKGIDRDTCKIFEPKYWRALSW